ncbi:hypothetical protein J7E50_07135 [Pedobacter sp. ISL-68]|nr:MULTISPECIES: hypothetical protein [unclassified Pedobacter]MBT2560604.1 hypothetical protein [Pedobacter sp. ISL-64]MBT2589983.1 hypothetical protein [Pedobacter sp. ISL-68]
MDKPEYQNAQFAMAFPVNYEPVMLDIKRSIDKLGIQVYFEDEVRML